MHTKRRIQFSGTKFFLNHCLFAKRLRAKNLSICITWGQHPCLPPSPARELSDCFVRGKVGHLCHVSLHAQSRWVTAVIGMKNCEHAAVALSPKILHLHLLPSLPVEQPLMPKEDRQIQPTARCQEDKHVSSWSAKVPEIVWNFFPSWTGRTFLTTLYLAVIYHKC